MAFAAGLEMRAQPFDGRQPVHLRSSTLQITYIVHDRRSEFHRLTFRFLLVRPFQVQAPLYRRVRESIVAPDNLSWLELHTWSRLADSCKVSMIEKEKVKGFTDLMQAERRTSEPAGLYFL